jgi:hypothetical protein
LKRAALEEFGVDKVTLLLDHYGSLLERLGCDKSKVLTEWGKIILEIARDENLHSMPTNQANGRTAQAVRDAQKSPLAWSSALACSSIRARGHHQRVGASTTSRPVSLCRSGRTTRTGRPATAQLRAPTP